MSDADICAGLDRRDFVHFTGKQRLELAMNSLNGIIAGMVADERINDKEYAALIGWLGRHREFADRHPFDELIPRVHQVIADRVIDAEERSDLLWLCEKFCSRSEFYDAITADMQQLHGFLAGIVADGIVNEKELHELQRWVGEREHLRRCWPYDELESIVAHVMRDGKIDDQEHEALLQFFGEFAITPRRQAVGALDRECTVSGVCAYCPEIDFPRRFFCFTGSSQRSTRDGLVDVIRTLGAEWHKDLRNDTDYLVVGASGNPCWAYACYGRKVEDAVARRRKGCHVLIVHEFDFWDAVADNGGVVPATD